MSANQVNGVSNAQQPKCNPAEKAQHKAEYEALVREAQSLGITNIPAPGKGAKDQLEALIAAKQAEQSNQANNPSPNNLFTSNTVGLGPSPVSGQKSWYF